MQEHQIYITFFTNLIAFTIVHDEVDSMKSKELVV
jgi:hypothetical protein